MKYGKTAKRYYKRAKRVAGKVKRFADKVNNNKYVKGAATLYSLGQKVAMLSHLVNIEKKRYDKTQTNAIAFAQSNTVGVSGNFNDIISPKPDEGVAQGQRIGQSIKVVSGCLDIQFTQQSSTVNALKIKWFIVKRADNSSSYSSALSIIQFFEVNPFSGVIDYYSARDPEYFSAFKVVKTGTVVLGQDQITSGIAIKQIKVPLKFNDHLKFPTDASIVTTKNQYYLFIVCSGGDTFLNTGATVQYNMRWYYTDN